MTHRHRYLVPFVLVLSGTLAACSSSAASPSPASKLPVRSVAAGAVEVKITPTELDASGAKFTIVLDTHSGDLSLDLTTTSQLDVGGTKWAVEGWTGDGPGGHHRTGQLRFTAKGPAQGTATLRISGLPEPVEATWELGGG